MDSCGLTTEKRPSFLGTADFAVHVDDEIDATTRASTEGKRMASLRTQ
ncbi:MAG: hypothetical protein AAF581_04590 [Planctomycetota bacterium]